MSEFFLYASLAGFLVSFACAIRDIKRYRDLITHMWVHDGYRRNGYDKMTKKQRELFDSVVGKEDEE